jgi:sugar-specific transcriptional regulator TrmB
MGGLVHLVLTRHEAQMYSALLRHGPSSARDSIAHASLDRATGYRVLARLRARSIVRGSETRPQRFTAVDPPKITDRLLFVLRDELELHRMLRDYLARGFQAGAAGSSVGADASTRGDKNRLLPGNETIVPYLVDAVGRAHESLDIMSRPQALRLAYRRDLAEAVARCLRKGVKVRLLLDCHPPDITFVVDAIRRNQGNAANLFVRFLAPQLARLWIVDQSMAVRTLNLPGAPHRIPELGIASEDPEFLRNQTNRFQSCWRDAIPIETALITPNRAVLSPPGVSRELREWLRSGHLPGHEPGERNVPPLSRP